MPEENETSYPVGMDALVLTPQKATLRCYIALLPRKNCWGGRLQQELWEVDSILTVS